MQSGFYKVNDVKSGKAILSNIFGTLSNEFHAMQLRPIQRLYTLQGLTGSEPLIDKTILRFRKKVEEEFVVPGKVCSIDKWLLYCATHSMSIMAVGDELLN